MFVHLLFFVFVIVHSGFGENIEVKGDKKKCDLKDEKGSVIISIPSISNRVIENIIINADCPETTDDKIKLRDEKPYVATLNKLIDTNRQQIAMLKLLISQQKERVTLLHSSPVEQGEDLKESGKNLTHIIEVIAREIGAYYEGYNEENLMFSDRTSGEYFPFVGLLGHGNSLESVEWRGDVGIILSDRHILTTAWRATEPYNGGLNFIAFGVKDRSGSRQDWQVHRFQKNVVHPGYTRYGYQDDVAVLETERPIRFSDKVKAACLPIEGKRDEEVSLVTWWNSRGDSSFDFVRSVKVQSYSETECVAKYHNYNTTTQVCYGDKSDTRNSCNSWSGDPLVTAEKNGCATVTGIRWYGKACDLPDVYTMLSHYVPWIYSVVKAH